MRRGAGGQVAGSIRIPAALAAARRLLRLRRMHESQLTTRFNRALALPLALLPLGCLQDEASLATREQAIASVMGGLEWSIDAPWRMEPPYGPVPITVTFHDASALKDPETAVTLRRFCGVSVAEIPTDDPYDVIITTYVPNEFHEIEASGKWPASDDSPSFHRLVRRWRWDSPEPVLDIGVSA